MAGSLKHLGDLSSGVLDPGVWKHHDYYCQPGAQFLGYVPANTETAVVAMIEAAGDHHTQLVFGSWERGADLRMLLFTAIRNQQLQRSWIQRADILGSDGSPPTDIPGIFPGIPFNSPTDPLGTFGIPRSHKPWRAPDTLQAFVLATIGYCALRHIVNPAPSADAPLGTLTTQWASFGTPPTGKWRWAAFACTPPVQRSRIFAFHNGNRIDHSVIASLELPEVFFELRLLVFVSLQSWGPVAPLLEQQTDLSTDDTEDLSGGDGPPSRPAHPPPSELLPNLSLLYRPLYDMISMASQSVPIVELWVVALHGVKHHTVLLETFTSEKVRSFAAEANGGPFARQPTLRLSMIAHGETTQDEKLVRAEELMGHWKKDRRFRLVLRVFANPMSEVREVSEWQIPEVRGL